MPRLKRGIFFKMIFESFKNKFREITGIKEQILSTVDHVYASMPVRLIDSHSILCGMNDVKVIIWDDIFPNLRKWESELVLDCGILATKNPDYFLYAPNKMYGLSPALNPNFGKQKKELEVCLNIVLNLPKYKKDSLKDMYLNRFEDIVSVYRNTLYRRHQNSTQFYKDLVIEMYRFLEFHQLAEFYLSSAEGLISTNIIDKYLSWLIEKTQNESFGLINLINHSSLFEKPYFRYVDSGETINELKTADQLYNIIELLKTKKLMPCKEIMYWLFAISNIKHFGRDFGFFDKLGDYFATHLKIANEFSQLQLTSGKDDGAFYIQYENDDAYQLTFLHNKWKARKYPIPRKNTDISTIPSIYFHIGNRFSELYNQYRKTKEISYVKMGEIL
jgi:hypothetical protein